MRDIGLESASSSDDDSEDATKDLKVTKDGAQSSQELDSSPSRGRRRVKTKGRSSRRSDSSPSPCEGREGGGKKVSATVQLLTKHTHQVCQLQSVDGPSKPSVASQETTTEAKLALDDETGSGNKTRA